MAQGIVAKIWNITAASGKSASAQISSSIDYIENPEKVGVMLDIDNVNQLNNQLMYVTDEIKTVDGLYVGGRHIMDFDNATSEMMQVKEFYGKLDGRVAMHGIISLSEEESDPRNAGKLMLLLNEFMERIFSEHQVVYAVHTNTENLHVHFVVNIKYDTTPTKEAIKQINKMKNSSVVQNFIAEKQIMLRKMGVGVLLKDQMTVSQWYMYKGMMAGLFFFICLFLTKGVFQTEAAMPISLVVLVIGWFFLDFMLRSMNKSSNEEMMDDIMEMSRSVLYGKRGGQYIADALKDSVMVVENKRLKTALIQLGNDLDSGRSLDDCLQELEMSFSNGEISSFCTVIKSLQSTGQVDEALRTLENNIEREQVSVNKRRCVVLEQKTTLYVILIAMDILGMLLYCIIMKLMDMQLGF